MKIAIFPNTAINDALFTAKGIQEFLSLKKIESEIFTDFSKKSDFINNADFFMTLGGDGTILKLKHHFPDSDTPILGVNVGHLGFMADIQSTEIFASLEDFLKGNFKIEERIMLEGHHPAFEPMFACNDIVIHRGAHPTIIQIAIHVDGSYFNTFEADGVIISTPNGSTAYSLAAGGPIITPELDAIVITPVCPHTISNRPLVISANHEIQIQYLTQQDRIEMRFDGSWVLPLMPSESCRIKKSNKTFKLVKLVHSDYFSTLRTKLNWQGRLRY
jgi:NAD+ kinase